MSRYDHVGGLGSERLVVPSRTKSRSAASGSREVSSATQSASASQTHPTLMQRIAMAEAWKTRAGHAAR